MKNKLDFSLPQEKKKRTFYSSIVIILLLIIAGLCATGLLTNNSNHRRNSSNNIASALSPEQTKQLATKLAGRNLYLRAAEVWGDYLASSDLSDNELARTLFQTASLYEKAGFYDTAIEYFYRSETAAQIEELEPQITAHIKDCFEKLGNFSALRYELMDRTSFKSTDQAGQEIVAEIGPEKITEADLDALIEETISNQLAPLSAFMTAEQLNEQKQSMLSQYQQRSAKQQFLQSWLAREVLYRQALQEELAVQPEVKKLIEESARDVLSSQLMNNELAGKINITETDLQTYYQANKSKYTEPADPEDPNSVAREKSFDEVREQVTSELINSKSMDVQQDLITQLMDKFDVVIHTSVFSQNNESVNSSDGTEQ